MRKTIYLLVFLLAIASQALAEKPDYEKYGRIAIAVVTADYPSDKVQDYQYMGRKKVTETTVSDSFRFKVEEKGKKFFVFVNVTHDLTGEKLLNLTVETEKP
ncbi:MAG TPA: DUF3889 domain-containing protein [Bacillales bacterium]|nr:DUF3889 domain-containing protein [Bacillales bacterium]